MVAAQDSTMPYHSTIRGERFTFADLRELFAKANEEKSGDSLAGIAADTRARAGRRQARAGRRAARARSSTSR